MCVFVNMLKKEASCPRCQQIQYFSYKGHSQGHNVINPDVIFEGFHYLSKHAKYEVSSKHAKYEVSISYGSKVMAKVKVFSNGGRIQGH